MLPPRGWASIEATLLAVGERRPIPVTADLEFLGSLQMIEPVRTALSGAGAAYFHARFIDDDADAAREILAVQVLSHCAEAAALAQLLAKRPRASRTVACTVLRSQGFGDSLTDRQVGSLLALMNGAGIIDYRKRDASFSVKRSPLAEPRLPDSVFISPETPWSNRSWLKRLLAECREDILWFDKHFLPEGLDLLGEAADGEHINEIRILSLALQDNDTRRARRTYRDLGRELKARGITLEWRFIESSVVRDTHDRWIISAARTWNVPNLNAILSGQNSELVLSSNAGELRRLFGDLWSRAAERPFEPSDDGARSRAAA